MLAASRQWPSEGVPDHPRGWLIRVASRRLVDERRSSIARADREQLIARRDRPVAGEGSVADTDDTLQMLLLCAHPASDRRLEGGRHAASRGRADDGPDRGGFPRAGGDHGATDQSGQGDDPRDPALLASTLRRPATSIGRLHAVRHALYLVFTSGHTSVEQGTGLMDVDLAVEAIRLAERLHRALPDDTETAGLLALMLLTHARSAARTDADGDLIPLDQQDRSRWDARAHRAWHRADRAGAPGRTGRAVPTPGRDRCRTRRIGHQRRDRLAPDRGALPDAGTYRPVADRGAQPGSCDRHGERARRRAPRARPVLERADQQRNHRLHAVHAHLLDMAGERAAASAAYPSRGRLATASIPEQRYLNRRAASLESSVPSTVHTDRS